MEANRAQRIVNETPDYSQGISDSHQYTILDVKDDIIPNLPTLIPSNPCISDQIRTILKHLSKFTFVQTLDNRRANSLLDLDFVVIVKARADHLNIHGSNDNITVSDGSNVDIEFRT